MRIIAGERRGLTLKTLPGLTFRPTLGRARESLFGILTPALPEARVLDLFAGSGALGLEALSRGANSALFIENSPAAAKVIEANIARAHYEDRCHVHLGDFLDIGKRVASGAEFDLVFADPPYLQGFALQVLELVAERQLLSAAGYLALEFEKRETPAEVPGELQVIREKKFGATMIWILRRTV
ncbi:MAG: 16S rRNA (guanine(966)-N(2))-methyltransferase RsmD [bacterium]